MRHFPRSSPSISGCPPPSRTTPMPPHLPRPCTGRARAIAWCCTCRSVPASVPGWSSTESFTAGVPGPASSDISSSIPKDPVRMREQRLPRGDRLRLGARPRRRQCAGRRCQRRDLVRSSARRRRTRPRDRGARVLRASGSHSRVASTCSTRRGWSSAAASSMPPMSCFRSFARSLPTTSSRTCATPIVIVLSGLGPHAPLVGAAMLASARERHLQLEPL